MTIPSRLSPTNAPRPHYAETCPVVFPENDAIRCEGVEGHEGPHLARITVTWEATRDGTVHSATARNGVHHGAQ